MTLPCPAELVPNGENWCRHNQPAESCGACKEIAELRAEVERLEAEAAENTASFRLVQESHHQISDRNLELVEKVERLEKNAADLGGVKVSSHCKGEWPNPEKVESQDLRDQFWTAAEERAKKPAEPRWTCKCGLSNNPVQIRCMRCGAKKGGGK